VNAAACGDKSMRISDDTRQKWSKAFGAELPEVMKPFAETERDEHVTNGGVLAHPGDTVSDIPFQPGFGASER